MKVDCACFFSICCNSTRNRDTSPIEHDADDNNSVLSFTLITSHAPKSSQSTTDLHIYSLTKNDKLMTCSDNKKFIA